MADLSPNDRLNRLHLEGAQALELSHGGGTHGFSILRGGTSVERFHSSKCGQNTPNIWSGHAHPVYHVVLYTQGEFDFYLNGRTHPFKRGTLAIANPGETHQYGPFSLAQEIVYKAFSFVMERRADGGFLDIPFHAFFSRYFGLELAAVEFPVDLDENQTLRLETVLDALIGGLKSPPAQPNVFFCEKVPELFALLVREVYLPAPRPKLDERSPLARARQALDANYARKTSVAELARLARMSPTYFIRAFRKQFGDSPINYLLELRLNAAKSLLITTEKPVKEIAALSGFGDVYYFSRTFKRKTGHTPMRYRKGHRLDA